MMRADVGIEREQRPEPDYAQKLTVERRPRYAGDHIIANSNGQRRDEQAERALALAAAIKGLQAA